jgi:hypothetical protein
MRNCFRPYGPIYGPLIAMLVAAMPVHAQVFSGSNANSTSSAVAGSRSTGAIAGTEVNAPITSRAQGGQGGQGGTARSSAAGGSSRVLTATTVNIDPGGAGGAAGAGDPPIGSPGLPYTANENISGTQTVRNVPELVAPNVSTNNPCSLGASAGGAGPGIGITFGVGYTDPGCERRNNAAVLNNLGMRQAAIDVLCQDDSVARALAAAGTPCSASSRSTGTPYVVPYPVAAQAAAAPAQIARVDPAVVRRQDVAAYPPNYQPEMITSAGAATVKPSSRPDWCYTASPQELRTHPQCD